VNALLSVYPEFNWIVWKFNTVPQGFWSDRNKRRFFDWLRKELGLESFEDWYNITHKDINKLGGSKLLYYYTGFWSDKKYCIPERLWNSYQGEFDAVLLAEIGNTLKISNLDEWYRVSLQELNQAGASGFVRKRGGLKKSYFKMSTQITTGRQTNSQAE